MIAWESYRDVVLLSNQNTCFVTSYTLVSNPTKEIDQTVISRASDDLPFSSM